MPKSLFGRFLLIIILPNIIMQLVAVFVFFERHWEGVSRHMADSLVGDITLVTQLINNSPDLAIPNTLRTISSNLVLDASFLKDGTLSKKNTPTSKELYYVRNHLLMRLPYPFTITYNKKNDIVFSIALPKGVVTITTTRKRLSNPSTYIFVMWVLTTACLLSVIAVLFARTQIRSIRRLSLAAEQFGRGQETDDFKPSGALEVRRAGKAFLMMKSRIKRQVEQRMEMLSGVSHDLKTPLTRMKLQLAMMEETEDIKALRQDASEMEKMLNEYLDFAKSTEKGPVSEINVGDLIRSIVAGYRQHHSMIDVSLARGMFTRGNSLALRRALTNLIDNGLRYGNHVWISSEIGEQELTLIVEDNGPGIPKSKRKAVFKPFYRLDSARNLDTAGSGLGLSITKDSIVSHGGTILLDESSKGGLKAIIKLPI